MRQVTLLLLVLSILAWSGTASWDAAAASQEADGLEVTVQPGDTWSALALRYGQSQQALQALNRHINTAREPSIGSVIQVPASAPARSGRLIRSGDGGFLATAVRQDINPWTVALANSLITPYRPGHYRATYVPDATGTMSDLPLGLLSMEMSQAPAQPGTAVAFRGQTTQPLPVTTASLAGNPVTVTVDNGRVVGIGGTGAFQNPGDIDLNVAVEGEPLWSQPWRFGDRAWTYQQLTLTGDAAAIDAEAIAAERERLRAIWLQQTQSALWQTAFAEPVADYLEISADYGGRRSYNGGPYLSYHEGVDFSAYKGTPVLAPAAGTVVLAEELFVRGGAVIIDHGLGIYSGYYHLSAINAEPGQEVAPGDILGEVGTTGLSTGNHLHWDLLVNGVWVDAASWRAAGMDCWVLEGLGRPCPEQTP